MSTPYSIRFSPEGQELR